MRDNERGAPMLRRPLAATLREPRSRERHAVRLTGIAATAVRFVAARSLPPGTACTLVLGGSTAFEIEVVVESSTPYRHEMFECSATIRRVRERDRARFEALLQRQRSATSA